MRSVLVDQSVQLPGAETSIDLRGAQLVVIDDRSHSDFEKALELGAEVKSLRPAEEMFFERLTAPKSKSLTIEEADAMRAGYDLAFEEYGVFRSVTYPERNSPLSARAHKAWVTMNLWTALIKKGAWTHDIRIQFLDEDGRELEVYRDRAVSLEHARSLVRKAKTTHRRRFLMRKGDRLNVRMTINAIAPSQTPRPVRNEKPEITQYRATIISALQSGPKSAAELQTACETGDPKARNLAAWAMVRLQQSGEITKTGKTYEAAK